MRTTKKICGTALALTLGFASLRAQNLYVSSYFGYTIGEYGVDGSTVNASLISTPAFGSPVAIAISGDDLFVANYAIGTISEFTTSGATVNASLITGLVNPAGIAISGNDLFVANA